MANNWYDELLLIADFIPPNPDEMEKFDPEEQVRIINDLGFNSQHIEVNDITVGEAGITFFKSDHAIQQRNRDLLKDYRNSWKKYGGNDIVYFNVHWLNKNLMPNHPEWFQVYYNKEFIPIGYGSGGYSCINSPFRDWAFKIIKDIGIYGIRGMFLDGPVFNGDGCYCEGCLSKFEKEYGFRYTPEKMKDINVFKKVMEFKHNSIAEFMKDSREALKSVNKDAVIFMNGLPLGPSTCGRSNRAAVKHQDALLAEGGFLSGDLRELPIWKPAASAKFLETQAGGKPVITAIAGRHGGWNRYLLTPAETWISFAMSISNGGNIWYGIYDTNRSDKRMQTVKEINTLLSSNAEYIAGTKSISKIGLVWSMKNANLYQTTTEEWDFVNERSTISNNLKSDSRKAFNGWFEVLQKSHNLFDIIDDYSLEYEDLSRYELIILPNVACMGEEEIKRITEYVKNGGNIITTYDTSCYDSNGLKTGKVQLAEVMGVSAFEGTQEMPIDHIAVEGSDYIKDIDQSLIPATNLFVKVKPVSGTKVHMYYREKQPSKYCDLPQKTDYPFITENKYGKGKAVMFTGDIDATYERYRFPEFYRIMKNAIELHSRKQIIIEDKFTSVLSNIREKADKRMLHLVNYTSYSSRPIMDIVTLNDINVTAAADKKPEKVKTLRGNKELEFSYEAGFVNFIVPELKEYEIIVIEY